MTEDLIYPGIYTNSMCCILLIVGLVYLGIYQWTFCIFLIVSEFDFETRCGSGEEPTGTRILGSSLVTH